MKRLIITLTVCLILASSLLSVSAFAANASASLTGPGTVRAGDKITLSFNLGGTGIYGASGTLSYDANQLTLTGTSAKISHPWAVEFNGNNFVAYDNNLSTPINSTKTLFTATFTVKDLEVGTTVNISCTNVKASDGSADANIGTVTYSRTVAAPLSSENKLASLKVSNAAISPDFNATTTNYTASVPYEVSRLDVSATPLDTKAKVTVDSPTLTANGTTAVTVTVTAENGDKKIYTIAVKRAADPNYVPSGNNKLSGISVEGFLLSPIFNADTANYVVWLPYETSSIKIGGSAEDGKATVRVVGGEKLEAGQDNIVQLICTAENGDEKVYTVIVKRASAHGDVNDDDSAVTTTPADITTGPADSVVPAVTTGEPTDTAKPAEAPTDSGDGDGDSNGGIAWWILPIAIAVSIAVGATAGIIFQKERS